MRLFTAVYPTVEASDHLDLALGGLRGAGVTGDLLADDGPGLRWVPKEQRHITLAFHGAVPDGAVPAYVDALAVALAATGGSTGPFDVALAGGGTFGARTLWAGVSDGTDELRHLSRIVEEAAAEAGFRPDEHAGGRPHMTLARASASRGHSPRRSGARGPSSKRQREAAPLDAWAHALAIYRGPAWPVTAVHLVASQLGQGRSGSPLHTPLAVIPLEARPSTLQ
ncbi:MAG: RNA 2',3'-cyclic phosphodiesterase [Cellulomonadaceae bacterium]|nr:RNA 2',3'-cyclic phosphodiesterase [Cellulomonadaceae bacterium]